MPERILGVVAWIVGCLNSDLPSGKLTKLWKTPFLMDKSTISMAMFHSYVTNYQRVSHPNGSFHTPDCHLVMLWVHWYHNVGTRMKHFSADRPCLLVTVMLSLEPSLGVPSANYQPAWCCFRSVATFYVSWFIPLCGPLVGSIFWAQPCQNANRKTRCFQMLLPYVSCQQRWHAQKGYSLKLGASRASNVSPFALERRKEEVSWFWKGQGDRN